MATAQSERSNLTESSLRLLVAGHAFSEIQVVGGTKGYVIEVQFGAVRGVLANTRGGVRRFASIDAAARLLKRLDLPVFVVNVTNFEPGLVRGPRPDRSLSNESAKPAARSSKASKPSEKVGPTRPTKKKF